MVTENGFPLELLLPIIILNPSGRRKLHNLKNLHVPLHNILQSRPNQQLRKIPRKYRYIKVYTGHEKGKYIILL